MIEAKNINFYYDNFHALKNINMKMKANTVTAFIGPSGCGKSTFLRLFNRMNDLIPGTKLEGECLIRSEEHTSELQSRGHLVCRLVLEKKNVVAAKHQGRTADAGGGAEAGSSAGETWARRRREQVARTAALHAAAGDGNCDVAGPSHRV